VSAGPRGGLCPECAHVKLVPGSNGNTYLLCRLASSDPRLRRYPPQPVVRCVGFRPRGEPGEVSGPAAPE
jgi:hypothetical protein